MHLTNYAINRKHGAFSVGGEPGEGSKQALTELLATLETGGEHLYPRTALVPDRVDLKVSLVLSGAVSWSRR
jgi:hypothetical protein